MRAIIQAGGKGTRLRNVTKDAIPKPMVPVLGKPLLQWQIEELLENEIKDIFIIIGHLGHIIQNYFGNGNTFGVSITYIVENEPLGTGGGLFYLKEHIKKEEIFIFLYGDIFFHIDLERMQHFHLRKKSQLTAFVHPNNHPYDSDLVVLDENDKIKRLVFRHERINKWYRNQVNAALYIINAEIISQIPKKRKMDFEKDILRNQIGCFNIYGYRSTEYVKDGGTEERLREIESDILSGFVKRRNLKYKQKCIFLDRDGTLNKQNGFIYDEEQLELIDGVVDAIKKINKSGYLAIVITNQPVIARGMCSIDQLELIHCKLQTLLGEQGGYIDDIIFCPHHPDKGYVGENPIYKISCNCRKPKIGMVRCMEKKYNISMQDSWMIGDTTVDIMTGKNAGMRTGLVLTGEAGKDRKYAVKADLEENTLLKLVEKMISG